MNCSCFKASLSSSFFRTARVLDKSRSFNTAKADGTIIKSTISMTANFLILFIQVQFLNFNKALHRPVNPSSELTDSAHVLVILVLFVGILLNDFLFVVIVS